MQTIEATSRKSIVQDHLGLNVLSSLAFNHWNPDLSSIVVFPKGTIQMDLD